MHGSNLTQHKAIPTVPKHKWRALLTTTRPVCSAPVQTYEFGSFSADVDSHLRTWQMRLCSGSSTHQPPMRPSVAPLSAMSVSSGLVSRSQNSYIKHCSARMNSWAHSDVVILVIPIPHIMLTSAGSAWLQTPQDHVTKSATE